jgi:D-sedoheptulose 7-phosphate isomerase
MDPVERIRAHFAESARLKQDAASALAPGIARAAAALADCLLSDGKILACGNGGSASDAQHFAAEMVGRFERERPELPAISLATDTSILTAVGNDYAFDQIFAKQVRALGAKGDVLLALSTSGNSNGTMLEEGDVHLCVPHDRTARIQEVHLLAIHCLCDAVDNALLGEER